MYLAGQGVPRDYAQAVRWTRLAVDQGFAAAQHNLGFMYANGRGVPQDYAQAVRWTRLAADQGDARAQYALGRSYFTGEGLPQDYVEAHKGANLAASRATGDYQKRYADERDALAKLMTPEQLAEAQQLARKWQAAFDARQE